MIEDFNQEIWLLSSAIVVKSLVKHPKFIENLRSINEMTEMLKCAPLVNVVSYEDDILLCEDEVDSK